MDILKITGLSKKYRNGRGIENIHIRIEKGEIFGFLGPNGSGKTTTLKLIMGILNKDAGNIEINGFDNIEQAEQAKRSVGAMFESTVHYGNLSALENLKQTARYYPNIEKGRMDELLGVVGLADYRKEKVKKFSLGMRQRLSVAQAMLGKPELLVLDEPFNGLDIEGIISFRSLFVELAQTEGTAFLISSHMAAEMEKMCTHIGVIKNGLLLGTDRAENILGTYLSFEDYFVEKVNNQEQKVEHERPVSVEERGDTDGGV